MSKSYKDNIVYEIKDFAKELWKNARKTGAAKKSCQVNKCVFDCVNAINKINNTACPNEMNPQELVNCIEKIKEMKDYVRVGGRRYQVFYQRYCLFAINGGLKNIENPNNVIVIY